MKKIVTTDITSTVGLPIKQGTLNHLQEAYQEAIAALAKGVVNDIAGVTILYGCENSTIAPIYTISAGAIYYNGEIYLVDAVTFTAADTAVAVSVESNVIAANADPVIFTDSNTHNVHLVRKITFADQASGSGISGGVSSNFDNLTLTNTGKWTAHTPIAGELKAGTSAGSNLTSISASGINYKVNGKTLSVNGFLQGTMPSSNSTICLKLPVGSLKNVLQSGSAFGAKTDFSTEHPIVLVRDASALGWLYFNAPILGFTNATAYNIYFNFTLEIQ